jgi:hypothetical protein
MNDTNPEIGIISLRLLNYSEQQLSLTKEKEKKNGRVKQIRRNDRKREDMHSDLPNNSSTPFKLIICEFIEFIFMT